MTTLTIYQGRSVNDNNYVVVTDDGNVLYSGKEWDYVRKYDFERVIINSFASVSALAELLKEEED